MHGTVHICATRDNVHARGRVEIGNARRGQAPYLISDDESAPALPRLVPPIGSPCITRDKFIQRLPID
jgi:hypothetical protein